MATLRELCRNPRVLLIEDNEGDALLTQLAFERCGSNAEVEVVRNAESGLRYLNREGEFAGSRSPDLILLDLNLPAMAGRQFLKLVKSNPALRHYPVVVLSSSSADTDVDDCYDSHCNGYLTKPQTFEGYAEIAGLFDKYWFGLMHYPSRDAFKTSVRNIAS